MKDKQAVTPGYLPVPTSIEPLSGKTSKPRFRILLRILLLTVVLGSLWAAGVYENFCNHGKGNSPGLFPSKSHAASCAQAEPLQPLKHDELWKNLSAIVGSSDFQSKAIDWLGNAVRIPTESWDNMDPVGVDPRWKVFEPFQAHLLEDFPLVHATLKLTKVNTYGLIFEWKGASPGLKPILMAAHQDVVPVETRTVDQWTHPPFSGYFDGQKIWGRGSSDDKSGLIGILAAVETLISNGFQPTRTVVLAFGFDEEVSGPQGAAHIADFLLNHFGKDGFAFVIDEGAGFGKVFGSAFAMPGIAEKGYIDVQVEVATAGGHSSIPPDHTSIGILAAMLTHLEQNPFEFHFSRDEPLFDSLRCFAEHGEDMPDELRKLIARSKTSDKALKALTNEVSKNRLFKSLAGTTQAIDIIHGGVKANALPEQAYALVNHRVAVTSSVNKTKTRDIELLSSLARNFNLTFTAFGENISGGDAPSEGSLTIYEPFHDGLEPAPLTPTGEDAAPYRLLSGTIKATYNSHRGLEGPNNIVVAPGMMTGNTDTRYYWDLSPSIFRYNHQNSGDSVFSLNGVHTVNENMDINTFLEMIRFFVTLILNSDESTDL